MNNRRKLLVALGASAFAASFGFFAQKQGKAWRIGYLGPSDRSASASVFDAFTVKMRELGYVEGKNLVIEWRSADDYERMPGLAELARLA